MFHTRVHIIILLITCLFSPIIGIQKGIVIVPIAELVGQPMKTFYPCSDPATRYANIPFCGANNNATIGVTCPRLHQLLLHEQVEILQEKDSELYIRIPDAFYVSHDNRKEHREFWTLKKYIASYDTLKKHNVPIENFPHPISRTEQYINSPQSVVTLKQPFFDRTTGQHLSAGTRFIQAPSKSSHSVSVYIFDPMHYRFNTLRIPKKFLLPNTPRTKKERIDLFVRILQSWAHQPAPYVIPYVLGGCSFIETYPTYKFSLKETVGNDNTKGKAYTYHNATQAHGFDCSGIILRAAQMAGIPYFCKNTSAIGATLKPLSNNEKLQNGDLILIPGHVIVIADTQKNTIIEARGYDQGYGKVHEIPLKEQFQNMHTFCDLVDAYRNKKPLIRLNRSGNVVQTIKNYQLLKLASAWD